MKKGAVRATAAYCLPTPLGKNVKEGCPLDVMHAIYYCRSVRVNSDQKIEKVTIGEEIFEYHHKL